MIPAPGIMIWLVQSLIVDIFEMNIWQIFVKLYDSNGSLWCICRSLLRFCLSTSRYFRSDSEAHLLCYEEEF